MSRRRFIKTALQGLPIAFLPTAIFSACGKLIEPLDNGKSVIIVGAGISGLAAAKHLKQKGFSVLVLESSEKTGGRLRTNRSLGFAFDEGASWIHGPNNNPITALANDAGANSFLTNDNDFIAYDLDGAQWPDSVYTQTENEYYNVLQTLMNSGAPNQSFQTVFENQYPQFIDNRLWRFILSTYLTFDTGDLDKLSSLYYDEGEVFGGKDRIITNGYDTITNFLAQSVEVYLNSPVTKIDYTSNKAVVTSNGSQHQADYVLVTVPLGVLKNNSIEFSPVLPSNKLNAIEKVGMGCVNKFVLTWETSFWDDTQYIAYTPEAKDKFNYFLNINKFSPNANALMTFAYADYARLTETMSDSQVISEIMAHLRDIYGTDIPEPTQMLRTKWGTNSNAFGAYSFTAVETKMTHFNDLAADINNTLFFAGEHTEVDYFSTAHGAYLSGIREANKIIELQ